MRTTLIFSCALFFSCAPMMSIEEANYEQGFDDVCELVETLELRLLTDDYVEAGHEYSDGIILLFKEEIIETDVIHAIWRSSKIEMTDPSGAYQIWTDAVADRGNDEWRCDALLSVFHAQNERYLSRFN